MPSSRLLRNLFLICGALIGAVISYLLIHRPARSPMPFEASIASAEKVSLKTGAMELALTKDGAAWKVAAPPAGPYKADPDRIKQLLSNLKTLTVEDVISTQPDRLGEFEINPESAALVSVYGKGNALQAQGVIGKQAPDFTHLYFKYPNRSEVYLARNAVRGDIGTPEIKPWRDRLMLDVAEDQVTGITIQTAKYKTVLTRSSDTWSLKGHVIEPGPVWGLLGTLAHFKAEDFADPSFHPELKEAMLLLQLRDGSQHSLHFGKMDPKTNRVTVASDHDPSVAWISDTTLKAIFLKPADFKPKT